MSDARKPSLIVRIPTPVWLIVLVSGALAADLVFSLPLLLQYKPGGIALIAMGVAVAASGRLRFRRSGAEIFPWSEAHSTLVTAGPFRFTRNPMYLGIIVIGIGAALIAGTWLMWLVPIVIFALDHFVIIPYEEKSMERAYGEEYLAYKGRVRRWI